VRASGIRRLPIFPLGIVAFPTAHVPLTIFEARYRVLFSTLLAGDEGIDNDLVQEDSEFKGSRQFGMSYCSPETGGVAEIGTVLEVTGHQPFDDGRLLVNTRGTQRFRILKVVQQMPVVVAECEILDEPDEEDSVEAHVLQEEVTEKFRAVWQLSNKIRKQPTDAVPRELGQLGPKAFSYWIAGMFGNSSQQVQQLLLQEDSIITRLRNLSEMLGKHIDYLRAAVALESINTSSDEPSKGADKEGGDDKPVQGDDAPQTS
jgi:Lon protease-like protein